MCVSPAVYPFVGPSPLNSRALVLGEGKSRGAGAWGQKGATSAWSGHEVSLYITRVLSVLTPDF